jgi:hypothetical protein
MEQRKSKKREHNKMASTLEIVNGISQVMSNVHDGAVDTDGDPIKVGLKREEGHPINDSRVMDGFTAKVYGNKLCIGYHAEASIKDVHSKDFEPDIEQMIEDIASFLKKEFKKVTGNALSLKKEGEPEIMVQNISRIRSTVVAKCHYEIKGLESEGVQQPSEDRLDSSIKSWLELGNGKKAKNDTRKKDTFDHFDATNIKSGIRK